MNSVNNHMVINNKGTGKSTVSHLTTDLSNFVSKANLTTYFYSSESLL